MSAFACTAAVEAEEANVKTGRIVLCGKERSEWMVIKLDRVSSVLLLSRSIACSPHDTPTDSDQEAAALCMVSSCRVLQHCMRRTLQGDAPGALTYFSAMPVLKLAGRVLFWERRNVVDSLWLLVGARRYRLSGR